MGTVSGIGAGGFWLKLMVEMKMSVAQSRERFMASSLHAKNGVCVKALLVYTNLYKYSAMDGHRYVVLEREMWLEEESILLLPSLLCV